MTDSPRPRSYSQLHAFQDCPERFRLERLARKPSRPGVWLPAGTAVHKTVERWLRAKLAAGEKDTNGA